MGLFSSSTTVPASGFFTQPAAYQQLYNSILGSANSTLFPNGQLNSQMFTPIGQTDSETQAYNAINKGITPTSESLASDVSILMGTPYDSSVINNINREATGQNSLVNQAATQAGQQGSNRSFLGTSDVEQNRLNNIGMFRQNQYQTAVNQSLGQLSQLRQQDINNQLGEGANQRALAYQTSTAPYTALQAAQGSLNAIPTSFGNFGSPQSTVKSTSGLGSLIGAAAPIIGSAFGPLGAIAGGAIGGYAGSGGSLTGALQGGLSGGLSGGIGNYAQFGGSGLNGLGQGIGSLGSGSSYGPYQSFFGGY